MKTRKLIGRYLVITVMLFFAVACSDEEIKKEIPAIGIPVDSDEDQLLFIAYNESINGRWVAKVMQPGRKIISLTDGKKNALASSITVANGDVYISGHEQNAKNQYYAKYWKNGIPVSLTDSTSNLFALAEDIAVSANDMYVAGNRFNGQHTVAVYWKNGKMIELTDGKTDAYALCIAVSGTDVYVGGSVINKSEVAEAVYWKNGEEIKVNGEAIASIFAKGNDVFAAGVLGETARYILNQNVITLDENVTMNTSAIFADDDHVYVAGPGMYWKDDTVVSLIDPTCALPMVTSMFVLDGKVYVGGGMNNGTWVSRYWIDGSPVDITDGTHNASISSLCVIDNPFKD